MVVPFRYALLGGAVSLCGVRQMQGDARDSAGTDEHIVLPLRSHPQCFRANIVQPLMNSGDPEAPVAVGAKGMRSLAVCSLPKNRRKGHRSAFAVQYHAVQNAFGNS